MTCGSAAAVFAILGFFLICMGIITPGWLSVNINLKTMVKSASSSISDGLSSVENLFGIDSGDSSSKVDKRMDKVADKMSKVTLSMSIFYARLCVEEITCVSGDLGTLLKGQQFALEYLGLNREGIAIGLTCWIVVQSEGAAAIVLALIGMVLSFMPLICARKSNKGAAVAAFFFLGASGIVIVILMGEFIYANYFLQSSLSILEGFGLHIASADSFHYSLLMSGFGAACLLFGALAAIISVCQMSCEGETQGNNANHDPRGLNLAIIVPGIQNTNEGYTQLQESTDMACN